MMLWERIIDADHVLDKMEQPYTMEQHDEQTDLLITYFVGDGEECTIRLIGNESAGIMGLYVHCLLCGVPLRKCRQLLPLLNDLNGRERFFRFYFDSDGDVNVAYDFPDQSPAPEKSLEEAITKMKEVLREVYPELKAALANAE